MTKSSEQTTEGFSLVRKGKWISAFVLLVIALIVALVLWFSKSGSGGSERKPLYWVAPMDANYRRDEPGLSPMGMDLVPVYAEGASGSGEGVVSISSEIQNQLGVKTTRIASSRLEQSIRSYGRVIFDHTLVSKLSPRVSGWVDMLFIATEGESVRRGQPIYSLYSPELIAAQERFLKILSRGDAALILDGEGELRALKMDDVAINNLKEERVVQQSVVFHSPKDGVVGMLKVGEDHYVEPGDLIMAIGSLEDVWVELDVFESQASQIKPQQLISFSAPAYPELYWEGEVDYIYPALDSREQSLRFRAKVENRRMLLKPNMHVQALIALPERDSQVLVPRQSVISLGEQDRVVLALGEGRFKSVEVTLGESNSELVEVLDGVVDGDTVVTSAQFLIDSESSKTSDFMRMQSVEESESVMEQYPPTWVRAIIEEINLVERKLRLTHDYIEDWKMPSMTMYFQATDDVDLDYLKLQQEVRVHVTDGDPLFQVDEVQALSGDTN